MALDNRQPSSRSLELTTVYVQSLTRLDTFISVFDLVKAPVGPFVYLSRLWVRGKCRTSRAATYSIGRFNFILRMHEYTTLTFMGTSGQD
jgi:hypothetical protein